MNWPKMKLGDCCYSIADGDHQPPPKSDCGIPFVTIANIQNNNFDFENTMFVPKSYYDSIASKRKAQKGDVLYSVVGSFGIPVLIKDNRPFVFQRHIAILKCNTQILNPNFLYYTMLGRDFYLQADAVAVGAAQRTISLSALRGLKISIPSISMQDKIANALSAYDDLIENNRKQIKLLEEAAQRLYKEWFVDLRFPGHEKSKIVDGIPKGWKTFSIADIGNYLNGYAFKPDDWGRTGRPIIKIKEMNEGIKDTTPRYSGNSVPAKYVVKPGEILFSWSATLCTVVWDSEEGLLNQHLFKVTPNNGICREFLFQSIKNVLQEFSNLTTGSTMKHIQRGKFNEVFARIPDSKTMHLFSSIGDRIRDTIIETSKCTQLLKEARDRLLPKLMSGEIEV